MLPSDTQGTEWEEETVWDKYEWPNLGSAVTEVIRVNPDNDDQETILVRRQRDPAPTRPQPRRRQQAQHHH